MGTLVVDLGTHRTAAVVVNDKGTWMVPDPTSGEAYWRSCVYWDGSAMTVGALAEHRRAIDPAGFATGLKRGLALDVAMLLGARRFRPTELVAAVLGAVRTQALRHGPIVRALLTLPADQGPEDPRRTRLVAAAEAVGFDAVELLPESIAAVHSAWPGAPFRPGEVVLVHDFGAGFTATLVRIGDHRHEILGYQSIVDAQPLGQAGFGLAAPSVDQTLTCCHDLLARVGLERADWVLPVGSLSRTLGLSGAIERGLGIGVRRVEDPEFAVVRGAAQWLIDSGPRTITGRPSGERLVPLAFTVPGGTARLLRWLVTPEQPYEQGAPLARVRLSSGAIWDLTARTRGTLEQILIGDGAPVTTGEWLGLART